MPLTPLRPRGVIPKPLFYHDLGYFGKKRESLLT